MLTEFLTGLPKVYLAVGFTDMRKSLDGLSALVEQKYNLDPFQTAAFLFCGRKSDRIKILIWDSDGYLLLYKRLENGSRYQWARSADQVRGLSEREIRWLLECIDIDQPKASKKFYPKSLL